MNGVTVVWSMISAACLTLAGIYFLVWWRQRTVRGNFLFSLSAVATAAMAGCELWMMHAETPSEFGLALRWLHLPAWMVILSQVGFVRVYLRAGRPWLAWAAVGVRTLSLILNFILTPNLNYREISSLRHVLFLGEKVAYAEGVPSPWMLVGQVSLALMVVFVGDATITVWRRGERRKALLIGASIVFFFLVATGQTILSMWGIVHMPLTPSVFYLGVIATMGYELSHDVLRAARLARELQTSEKRLTLAAAAARLAHWEWDMTRDRIWVSDRARALYSVEPHEDIDFHRFVSTVHEDDRPSVRRAVEAAIAGSEPLATEYHVKLPDGGVRWIALDGRVERDGQGRATMLRGVSLDITERKLTEKALRESEARFRTVADSAPVMIWMAGTDKLCNFFNKGWLDFTGRTLEQELGNGWAEGVHPDDFERCLRIYTTSFDAQQEFTMQYRLRDHDGGFAWVLDTGVPRIAVDGTFLGFIGSAIDITHQRQEEERFRLVIEACESQTKSAARGGSIVSHLRADGTLGGVIRQDGDDLLVASILRGGWSGAEADDQDRPPPRPALIICA